MQLQDIASQITATILSAALIGITQLSYKKYKEISEFKKIIIFYFIELITGIGCLLLSLSGISTISSSVRSMLNIISIGCFIGTTLLFIQAIFALDKIQSVLNDWNKELGSTNQQKPLGPK